MKKEKENMQNFQKKIDEIIEKINYLESKRIEIGKFIREINDSFKIGPNEEILDEKIINKIHEKSLSNFKVLGVDGGIVKHSYHGLDLLLIRTVGVKFEYFDGKLKNVEYNPSPNPLPNPKIIFDPFSDVELSSFYNFERQISEIRSTIDSMKKFNPDITFLDGSVIPHYIPKPENPTLKKYYEELIETYRSLFKLSLDKKIIVAGIIEDSRGIKFCDILIRSLFPKVKPEILKELKTVLEKTKDSNLLYYVLEKGERTCVFNYSRKPESHPILKEFEDMNNSFHSFYIKTVEFDRPLRVDFLGFGNKLDLVDKISCVLMQTSGHSGYGLPSVLIEADQRARLSENDLEMFYSDVLNRIGNVSTLFKMRRETRPF